MLSELDQADFPIIIITRDRVSPLRQLVEWLESAGLTRVTFVDNNSTYPPLLDYLHESPYEVVRLGRNWGHRSAWICGVAQERGTDLPYVVTDPDVVPTEDCPHDILSHFARLLDRYPEASRVGCGLKIDDLPASNPNRDDVIRWERQFWTQAVEPGVFAADIDTTFALYRPGVMSRGGIALRTGEPYTARHLPWYDNPHDSNDEAEYYRRHADPAINSWNTEDLPPYLRRLIDDHH